MRFTQRLLVGSLIVIGVLVIIVVTVIDRRVGSRLIAETTDALSREGTLIAAQWRPGLDPDSLADHVASALRVRVTLIDSTGRVVGDSEFDGVALSALENHSTRPEVVMARAAGTGSAHRFSPSAGDEELYVAIRAPLGTARVSLTTLAVDEIVGGARRDVLLAALASIVLALMLASILARSVSRPLVELSDSAAKLAAGDLSQRFALVGPGEIGDLASALRRMADEMAQRIRTLESEDALMEALIESLSEGVIALDARGRVVRINESARRLLRLPDTTPFESDWLPRDRVLREAINRALMGKDVPAAEASIDERTLVVSARPLQDGGAVLTIFDLTPLRRIETVRRDFVANASHELKTPLTVISGFAETLADDDPPEPQRRQFAAAIRANAQRMQRLIDDLLDLSRIESGGWVPNPVDVDVAKLVEELTTSERLRGLNEGVRIEVTIANDARRIRADATAVRQILLNLIDNAVRYTETGRVRIFSNRDHEGIWIGVEDTGPGIPAVHLPRIFERFYRADPSRARDAGGTGLGLAIVRHLAEAHGGRVRADSVVGSGTTVAVLLPQ